MAGEDRMETPRWRHSAARVVRHLFVGHWALRRDFPRDTRDAITAAVRRCESQHAGQIRVVIEAAVGPAAVWAGLTPRQRAIDLFGHLRVWDTEHNDGVLVHLLLADRRVEIVADRGVAGGHVPDDEWAAVARLMEAHFRARRFREGVVAGVDAVAGVLSRHSVDAPDVGNDLPDAPLLLG